MSVVGLLSHLLPRWLARRLRALATRGKWSLCRHEPLVVSDDDSDHGSGNGDVAEAAPAARQQALLEAVAKQVVKGAYTGHQAKRMLADPSFGEGAPQLLEFLDVLIQQAGSGPAASRALKELQEKGGGESSKFLEAWAAALARPEAAAAGPGEDPWEDLPTKNSGPLLWATAIIENSYI
ncbi:unnamed protein product [Symbiodinium natans]|uniref:Uncharacterized protein n=1 Tax=Symbiodinium natans TaxID=878477 RepID=A0A812RU44_9DINO|nr:unnamed protein product [Symbiodinium natans]